MQNKKNQKSSNSPQTLPIVNYSWEKYRKVSEFFHFWENYDFMFSTVKCSILAGFIHHAIKIDKILNQTLIKKQITPT